MTTATRAAPAAAQLAQQRLTAYRLIHPPRAARWFARLLLVLFVVSPFVLAALPWQQSFSATGRVIAFDPTERQQEVEAPVDGRIVRWHVKEGDKVEGPVFSEGKLVKPGTRLVSIQDPDPDLLRRLADQRQAVLDRQEAAKERMASFTRQVASLESSRGEARAAAGQRVKMAQARQEAAANALDAAGETLKLAETNFQVESTLVKEGLTAQLTYLAAEQRRNVSRAEKQRAANNLSAAKDEVLALESDLKKTLNDADAAISSARASKQAAEAELATARRDLAEVDTRIARQGAQEVYAPCDGVVYRILANASRGGAFVKSGERLVAITPTILHDRERVVELFLDGNDALQLLEMWRGAEEAGERPEVGVRLQFDGYPALQIIGWPNVAWGTFGGKVDFVDPHDDGKGRFRVLVRPDEEGWPPGATLRQGTRVQGWVLLNRVSLGWELWRRFNGFPPVVTGKGPDEDGKAKPAKVKVPK